MTAGLEGTKIPGVLKFLYCHDDGYSAWNHNSTTDIRLPPAGSDKVGVYLDRPDGTLSCCYRMSPDVGGSSDTLTHIHTFQSTLTQEYLLPRFELWWVRGSSVSLCRLEENKACERTDLLGRIFSFKTHTHCHTKTWSHFIYLSNILNKSPVRVIY